MHLDDSLHDAFKKINSKKQLYQFLIGLLPEINENGTKEMLLEANNLMGDVLMKMGALSFNNHAYQEESKIADETGENF